MPELEERKEHGPTQGHRPAPPAPGDDPIAHLHKMSTTAGATSQEYVAINPLAITALVLGLMSWVAFFGWILLVVPIVAVLTAVLALRQIADSNGTQTGRPLAWLGLLLAVGCAGTKGLKDWREHVASVADRQQMNAVIRDLGQSVKSGQYDKAYALFDRAFQSRISREKFEQQWKFFQQPELAGPLDSMEGNGQFIFEKLASGERRATTQAISRWGRIPEAQRYTMLLEKKPGQEWKINRFEIFPEQQEGPAPGEAPPR